MPHKEKEVLAGLPYSGSRADGFDATFGWW
jgi:hypothetical protein